jgi:hypothetical protein
VTVLYSDNDNVLGAIAQDDQTVNNSISWTAQAMHDFYYSALSPNQQTVAQTLYQAWKLLSMSTVVGAMTEPMAYLLVDKLNISGWSGGDTDSDRIKLLQSKFADPAAGLPLAGVAEALFILDEYGMPHIDQHKKLFSIYHIANIFVYPLSYFFENGSCENFYDQWRHYYKTFKAPVNGIPQDLTFPSTLAEQQQFMRQNLKDAFNLLSLGMYFANQFLNTQISWSDAAKFVKDFAFDNESMSAWLSNNAPYFEDELSNNIATILLTGILTDGAMPEPAMGYRGVKVASEFANDPKYQFNNQKDGDNELLPDHCGMMLPTAQLMAKVYQEILMQDNNRGFKYFGKYKAIG